jgi:hypothetical protein
VVGNSFRDVNLVALECQCHVQETQKCPQERKFHKYWENDHRREKAMYNTFYWLKIALNENNNASFWLLKIFSLQKNSISRIKNNGLRKILSLIFHNNKSVNHFTWSTNNQLNQLISLQLLKIRLLWDVEKMDKN